MASRSTIPNDSPPREGAHSTSAAASLFTFSSSERTPSQCTVGDSGYKRRSHSVSGPLPAIHKIGLPTEVGSTEVAPRAPILRPVASEPVRIPNPSSRTRNPLRSSCRPRNKIVGPSLGHRSASRKRSISTPLNSTSYSPPIASTTAPTFPMLPTTPQRATHDYERNGTVDLFAALDVASGTVITDIYKTHNQDDFVAFLNKINREVPALLDVHIILDNLSAHKAPAVRRWLLRHHSFHLH